jgi:hypothetical protein
MLFSSPGPKVQVNYCHHLTSVVCKLFTFQASSLESVQIEAGRIITSLRCNSPRQKLYHELGWKTLENRRNKHKLILFYKILNGLTPAYLYELVQKCVNLFLKIFKLGDSVIVRGKVFHSLIVKGIKLL